MQKNNRKKRNNKGFSMVELIIVIAIMAALVGILAPQYVKYVEKSRESADLSAADSILTAVKTLAIDPEFYDAYGSKGFQVTWDTNGTGAVTLTQVAGAAAATGEGGADVAFQSAIQAITGTKINAKSKKAEVADFVVTVASSGSVTVTLATGDLWTGNF